MRYFYRYRPSEVQCRKAGAAYLLSAGVVRRDPPSDKRNALNFKILRDQYPSSVDFHLAPVVANPGGSLEEQTSFLRRVGKQTRPTSDPPTIGEFDNYEFVDVVKDVAPYGRPARPPGDGQEAQELCEYIVGRRIADCQTEGSREYEGIDNEGSQLGCIDLKGRG